MGAWSIADGDGEHSEEIIIEFARGKKYSIMVSTSGGMRGYGAC